VSFFSHLAGFAIDLAGWTNSQLEAHRIIEILANEHLRVDLLELDVQVVFAVAIAASRKNSENSKANNRNQ
jgi:hypothetical protein